MKNTLTDLNNLLFEQMERLMDDELDEEVEVKRANALKGLAEAAIDNAALALKAEKFKAEFGMKTDNGLPPMIEGK